MGILSLGRFLIIRQVFMTGLILVFGLFAYNLLAELIRLGEAGADAAALVAMARRSASLLLTLTGVGVTFLLVFALPVTYFTVAKPVRVLFELVRLHKVLDIHENRAEALAANRA